MRDQGPYTGKLVMFTHEGTAMVLASLPPGFVATGAHVTTEPLFAARRPEPLLAQPGELAVGRAEIDLAVDLAAKAKDLERQMATLLANTPSAQWFARARAVMDLLASPEPPEGFAEEVNGWHEDSYYPAIKGWAWLRRQAGLEGE